jgi:hypothetical protein
MAAGDRPVRGMLPLDFEVVYGKGRRQARFNEDVFEPVRSDGACICSAVWNDIREMPVCSAIAAFARFRLRRRDAEYSFRSSVNTPFT